MSERIIELSKSVNAGNDRSRRLLLRELASSLVIIPVVQTQSLKDKSGTQKIRIEEIYRNDQRFIPMFATEELYLNWTTGEHQMLSLVAGDVALTLPPGTGIILNAGSESQIVLSAAEAKYLSEIELTAEEELPASNGHTKPSPEDIIVPQPVPQPNPVQNRIDENRWIPGVEHQLREILADFPAVSEAYLVYTDHPERAAVLGLLTDDRLNSDSRFGIVEQIAMAAKKHFGAAGAIEVYDDLYQRNTRSWELFRSIKPLYSRS